MAYTTQYVKFTVGDLDITSAQWARGMPYEPIINARQMKHMLAVRQAPHCLPNLEVLKLQNNNIHL